MLRGFITFLLVLYYAPGPSSGQTERKPNSSPPATMTGAWFAAHQSELLGLYTHLHRHPELSYQEVETAARIAKELTQAGGKSPAE